MLRRARLEGRNDRMSGASTMRRGRHLNPEGAAAPMLRRAPEG
jgi:hypothetical protein